MQIYGKRDYPWRYAGAGFLRRKRGEQCHDPFPFEGRERPVRDQGEFRGKLL